MGSRFQVGIEYSQSSGTGTGLVGEDGDMSETGDGGDDSGRDSGRGIRDVVGGLED